MKLTNRLQRSMPRHRTIAAGINAERLHIQCNSNRSQI